MQTSPNLEDVAPELFDQKPPPADFIAEHLDPTEMQELLGVEDHSQFWLMVRNGEILPPVWLPTAPPLACWNEDVVRHWIECGKPMDPSHWAHRQLVYCKLIDSVRGSLSNSPPTRQEMN